MPKQAAGSMARDRILSRARALDDDNKKYQQQVQQVRREDTVPMRYRQGTPLAQQPQTTAKERILSRAKALGPQEIMSGNGDMTLTEYQDALKRAEKSIAQQDDRFGSDRAKETYKKTLLALSPVVSPVWTGVLALTDWGKNVQEREAAAASKTAKWLFGKSQKTPEEIVAEQQEAQAAARRREELASLDLAEYERLLEQAKKEAAGQQPKYNIHAMGGYDPAAENTEARKKADDMQQTYNQAKQVQYERRGLEALGKLNRKQLAAVETLVETPETGTAVMSARVAQDSRRKQATDTLKAAGYSDTEIGELVTWRSRQKDQEAYQKNVQWHENLADSGAAGAAAATVLSVPENLLSGLGAADLAMQNAQKLGGVDHPANYYTPAMRLYGGSNAARTTVSEKLERSTDATIFGQNVASVAYNIGTSMMDSGATAALAAIGVPPMVGSAFLGGSAATAAMVDAKERGIDDTNALWTGLFAGVAETLFEDVSLERLLTLKPAQGTLAKRLRTTMKNVGLQAATEGSEELFTSFANYITDRAINGGLSEYGTAVRAYMDQGMSHQTATAKASANLAGQMAMDFVAGGIAGGLMAGGKSAIDVGQQNRAVLQFGELAGTAAEDRLSADGKDRMAQKIKSRTEQGKTVSGGALREVMERTIEARNKETRENVRQRAQARLEELGDPNAESVSRVVAQLYDSDMSRAREERTRQALRDSKYGQQVANELEEAMGRLEQAEDADQGATAAWAENLPRYTSRGEYISELQRKRVNPQATDRRPVTGYKYNAETGQLDAIVKGEDGKTETIPKERAATTGQQEMLAYLAADLKEGAPAMIASYLDGQDLETYSRQWHNAYEYGAANVKRDYAMASQAVDQLNETQRGIAYDTGKAVYDQRMAQERQKFPQESKGAAITREGTVSLKGATVGGVTYAPVTQETMTRRQRDSVDVMRQLARVTGVDVVFYQSRANEKGEYTAANGFYRDGTVYLDINAGKNRVGDMSETAILLTASHELTHFIQEYSPAQYEQLRDFVVERLTEAEDVDLDALVQRHQKDQPELSYDEALDEVVADGCQMMLKDSQAAAQLAKKNRSLAGNIRSWLRKWVKRLQEAFRGLTAQKPEAQALTRYAKELQKIWDDALVGAAENRQQSDTAAGESAAEVRYEARESKDKDVVSVKQQLKAAESELSKTPVVSRKNVTANIEKMSTKQRLEWAVAELKASGYRVERPNGNTIEFSPKDINSGLRYLSSAGEIAAYSALPAVLKRGKEIYREANHKGRGYGTITFAAPVEINGVRGNMAVVVRQTKGQRYDVHRILMPDGSAFVFHEKANAVSTTVGGVTEAASSSGGTTPTINTASKDSIRPGNEKSNTKFSMREPVEQATRAVMRENKPHSDNQFDEMQIIGDVMMQAAQGKQTEAAIRRAFSQEGYSISESTAREIREVFRAATALPTGYFEAKPQRAVRFDEAKAVIVPDNISRTLKKRIESAGVPIMEYRAGDESQRLKQLNSDETWRFSVREAKITDREVLANALESTTQNDEERRILKWYREVAKSLTEHEQLLEDMRQQLADHKSGKKILPKGKAKDLENYMEYIVNKLDEEDRKLLKIESMGPMRKLLEREREYVERRLAGAQEEKNRYQAEFEQRLQEARRHEQESLLRYRQRREESERRRALKAQIERSVKQLADRLNTNTDKKHIPEPLKKPVARLLTALDLSSQRALRSGELTNWDLEYLQAMKGIRDVLADQESYQNGLENSEDVLGGYLDLPPGMIDLLDEHMKKVENIIEKHMPEEHILRRMDTTELMRTQVILAVVTKATADMNQLLENRTYAQVADAAEDTIAALHQRGQYQGTAEKAEQFVTWDNTLPWYAFQRFGKGGAAIFEELMDGQDKLGFNMKKVLDFRKALIDDETARAWDTETHQVDLLDDEGKAVKATLTTAQLMGLYCLSRRKQAMGHLMGGGIRIANIEGQGKLGRKTIRQDDHFKMNPELLGQVLSLLTDQQIAVADKMQRFMTDQGGEWGNEVTMKRFGYRGFTEGIYYPIETDRQDRIAQAKDGTEGSLYRLQNISAVKPVVRDANNALVVRSIFDVFTDHMADMAKYNALVIPIVDAQKWYNYKSGVRNRDGTKIERSKKDKKGKKGEDSPNSEPEHVVTRTVQRAMTKAYGQSANRYVVQLLKDLNGVKESGARGEQFAVKMISNYKRAAVAANLRVALLQPTAYVRAAAVLDYKYLAAAFGSGGRATDAVKIPEGPVSKSVIERAWYALLKKTGTLQAMNEMLENSGIALWKDMGFFDTDVGRSVRDQIKGKGSKLEKLVDKTMTAAEWGDKLTWARLWRACKLEVQEKQKLSGQALLEGTARRFREVVYQTQVVDSTMTRSDIMRSSSTFSKMFTSFMSEPTVSYNLVMEGTRQILKDKKAMGLKTAIGRNWKTAGRAYQAYVVSALAAAVVESLADALRDTDDDPLWEKLLDAFGGWDGNLVSDLNPLNKLPVLREVFNAIDGRDNGRMDTEVWAAFKKAYDILMESYRLATGKQEKATATTYYGNMTTYGKVYQTFRAVSMLSGLPLSAATRELVTAWNNTAGLVWPGLKCRTYENKAEKRARAAYSAILSGDSDAWTEAYKKWEAELLKDGNSAREARSAIYGDLKKLVRNDYYEGVKTQAESEAIMQKYFEMNGDETRALVKRWECYWTEGIKYEDMRSLYETDRLSQEEVVRLRKTYGGETADEAYDKIRYWDFCIEYPQYDDISETKANKFYDYCEKAGIKAKRFYEAVCDTADYESDKDAEGKTVSGSLKAKYVAYIQSLSLTPSQQKAMWLALKNSTWSDKGTPWE